MRRAIFAIAAIPGGRADAHPPKGMAIDGRGRADCADIDHGNRI